MDVKEIVEQYLKTHGCNGLYDSNNGCGCKVDDLMPCGEPQANCQPGYLDRKEDHWVFVPEKPEEERHD